MSSRTRIVLSAAIAVGMLVFSYWVTNLRLLVSGETGLMRKVELVRGFFKSHNNPMSDSVLLINVDYDRSLVIGESKVGEPLGYDRITDREKLCQLLTELKRRDDYKYILLDVYFGDDIHTPADSALFSTIASMQRIVIAADRRGTLADSRLEEKAGLVNYFTNYKFVSFAKYPYLVKGEKSLPLKMYEDITGHTIKTHGFYAADVDTVSNAMPALARQSIVLTFDLRCDSAYTEDGQKTWLNMGMDLLGSTYTITGDTITGDSILYWSDDITRDKYIVIGAFSGGDMHYSYMENQPGPAILFNAYLSLLHGHHIVSLWLALLLFAAFFFLAWLILGNQTLETLIGGSSPIRRIFAVIVSWIGYSMFLSILCVFTYLVMGEVYDIFLTATVFQFISTLTTRLQRKKATPNS